MQVAAAAALNGPQDCIDEIRAIYKARRDVLVESMGRAGWEIPSPTASMFAWAPVPEQYKAHGSMEFAKRLLVHAKVAVAPGIGFGEYGEGYVRMALVENEHRIRQAARNVKKFLSLRVTNRPRWTSRNEQSAANCDCRPGDRRRRRAEGAGAQTARSESARAAGSRSPPPATATLQEGRFRIENWLTISTPWRIATPNSSSN